MVKIIAATSSNGVIGKDNKLPFYYPEDLANFKKLTTGCNVIMGRLTYESIGKPLPNRNNIVITRRFIDGITVAKTIRDAINMCNENNCNDIWIIGGASIYQEGMNFADEIHLTITKDYIEGNVVKFPWINPLAFDVKSDSKLGIGLHYVVYNRK